MDPEVLYKLEIYIIVFGLIAIPLAYYTKSILDKRGFKVNYFLMSFGDISNLKKLSKTNIKYRYIYVSLVFFTICFYLSIIGTITYTLVSELI